METGTQFNFSQSLIRLQTTYSLDDKKTTSTYVPMTCSGALQVGNSGQTLLAEQFEKMNLTSKNITDEMYSIAANEENIAKNRDRDSMPCEYSDMI